jgi:uncharacterized DUF497 family protein
MRQYMEEVSGLCEYKARINLTNPPLSFATAQRVFDDPNHLSVQDRHEEGEEVSRIISAPKATPKERQHHEKGY